MSRCTVAMACFVSNGNARSLFGQCENRRATIMTQVALQRLTALRLTSPCLPQLRPHPWQSIQHCQGSSCCKVGLLLSSPRLRSAAASHFGFASYCTSTAPTPIRSFNSSTLARWSHPSLSHRPRRSWPHRQCGSQLPSRQASSWIPTSLSPVDGTKSLEKIIIGHNDIPTLGAQAAHSSRKYGVNEATYNTTIPTDLIHRDPKYAAYSWRPQRWEAVCLESVRPQIRFIYYPSPHSFLQFLQTSLGLRTPVLLDHYSHFPPLSVSQFPSSLSADQVVAPNEPPVGIGQIGCSCRIAGREEVAAGVRHAVVAFL